jgi:hypothetical protein
MNQRCIENQTPPDLKPGATVDYGEFFRNLKDEHVVKRYGNDDNESPLYGFKLSTKHWKYADKQAGGLSVNLRSCIHSEVCSIALHPGSEDYFHVALIDLKAMNDCGLLASPLVAQYSPIEETHNRCHFEIVPLDGTVLKWMELRVFLDSPFPQVKVPSTSEEKGRATAAYTAYRSYCDIRRWVRRKDGTLE